MSFWAIEAFRERLDCADILRAFAPLREPIPPDWPHSTGDVDSCHRAHFRPTNQILTPSALPFFVLAYRLHYVDCLPNTKGGVSEQTPLGPEQRRGAFLCMAEKKGLRRLPLQRRKNP
jgi:hypothetical protein